MSAKRHIIVVYATNGVNTMLNCGFSYVTKSLVGMTNESCVRCQDFDQAVYFYSLNCLINDKPCR